MDLATDNECAHLNSLYYTARWPEIQHPLSPLTLLLSYMPCVTSFDGPFRIRQALSLAEYTPWPKILPSQLCLQELYCLGHKSTHLGVTILAVDLPIFV